MNQDLKNSILEETINAFALHGKITEQHAQDIQRILSEVLDRYARAACQSCVPEE